MTLPTVFRIVSCACFLFLANTSHAQIRLAGFGTIQSANIKETNDIPGNDTAQKSFYKSKSGFQLGVLAEIPIGKGFYFQPGLDYSSKGRKYQRAYDSSLSPQDTLYAQNTLKLNYVEIPAYLTYKLHLSADKKNSFFLSAGPYFAFIYGASQNYQNQVYNPDDAKYEFNSGTDDLPVGKAPGKYKTTDIGMNLKAGFEFGDVMLSGYYSHGFSNTYTADYPSSFHHNIYGATLGIWLTKTTPVNKIKKDTDKDGTPDESDACPTVPGTPKHHGCPVPDTDQDGVNDDQDSCVAVKGVAKYHGCPIPDQDGDGVNDEEDSCKTIAGVARYHGCPVPDRDGDGVNDEDDQCPDQPGTAPSGCPPAPPIQVQTIQQINYAASNVQFRTSSIRLTESSNPALRQLADTLRTHPSATLTIDGFTDDIGAWDFNISLSKKRAEIVKRVLVKLGIAASRIETNGKGEAEPVGDNRTEAGRASNRRVEMRLQNGVAAPGK